MGIRANFATGSEVHLALGARDLLAAEGVFARVVSMPSWEVFAVQTDEYRQTVLPPGAPRLAVEAGITRGWREYVGDRGDVIGLDRFGASAPGDVVMERLGFAVHHVAERARRLPDGPPPGPGVEHRLGPAALRARRRCQCT